METSAFAHQRHQASPLTDRDWGEVERSFDQTFPYNFAVLDDFFTPSALEFFQKSLLSHWGWGFINWQARELFIRNFEHPLLKSLIDELKTNLPTLLNGNECVTNLAFMYIKNEGLHPHSDLAAVTVNTWMTPDEFNLEPGSGGLILHDVKREEEMMVHEFNAAPYCVDYFKNRTKGQNVVIPYRCNRTVIFDSRTFHSSDRVAFRNTSTASTRMNFGLSFDDPDRYSKRFAPYEFKLYKPSEALRSHAEKQGA